MPTAAPSKRAALRTILKKLEKLIPHFTNANDREALTALRKATHLLASAKLDWHDLTALLVAEPQSVLNLLMALLGKKDVDLLLHIARERTTFFHTASGDVYATIDGGEILSVSTAAGELHDWLMDAFISENKRAPTASAVKNAIQALQAVARRRSERAEVYMRSAAIDNTIYIDLADDQHHVVEISASGWRIINDTPIKFLRPTGMRPLPEPRQGGSIEQLRPYANLTDAGFILFTQLLIDALHQRVERPVGCLIGGEGRAKSSLAKVAQRLLDPRATDPGNPPTTVRELTVRARNGIVLIFDNLSTLSQDMSDAICRLSSGVDSGMRKLFTDATQFGVRGSRSILFTAVKNPVTAPDLAERQVLLRLSAVTDKQRVTNRKFWSAFERDTPDILGGLYDIVAHGLRELPHVRLARLPRLAEFVEGGVACEGGHRLGSFMAAFESAAREALDDVIEDHPVALAVAAFMASRDGQPWKGSATALKIALETNDPTEQRVTEGKKWPHDVRPFGVQLWGMQTALRKAGIELSEGERSPDRRRGRTLELRMVEPAEESTTDKSDMQDEPDNHADAKVIALPSRK
jgi:hypothetical protein